MVNELIFADAKKNETAKTSYRELVAINECFKQLTSAVDDTGKARNAVLALESEEAALKTRVARLDAAQLEKDLADVAAANQDAEARLLRVQVAV